jgi:hypothetical protein
MSSSRGVQTTTLKAPKMGHEPLFSFGRFVFNRGRQLVIQDAIAFGK